MPPLLTVTPPRRPLSLPPTSPFTSPFTDAASPHSPVLRDPISALTSSYAFISPQTASSYSSFDVSTLPSPAQALRTAYIAGRSSADLINVLDLCTPRTREKLLVETESDSEKMIKNIIISRPIPQQAAVKAATVVKETGGDGDGGGAHGQGGGDVASAPNNTEDDEAGSESDFGIASPLFITTHHPFPAPPPRPPRPAVSPFDVPADQGDQEVIIHPSHHLSAFHHPNPRSIDAASPTASSPPTTGRSPVPAGRSPVPAGQSFFRWSATGSSVAPSDFSPPPSSVDTYAPTELQFANIRREHQRTEEEDKDKSFSRLTRTTFYSDFSAPSTVPDVSDVAVLPPIFKRGQSTGAAPGATGGSGLTAIPETSATSHVGSHKDREELSPIDGLPTVREKEKRSSAGTFGHKAPRYNSIHSTTSSAFSPPGSVTASPEQYTPGSRTSRHLFSDRVVVSDEPRVVPSRRRPLSFSSSSTVTGSAHTGPPSMSLDDSALAARQALGMLVSPTRRAVHKHPESEQAIEAHLRKQSQGNERRIIPAKKDDGLGPAIELGGEEMERGTTPVGRGAGMGMGKRSKVDQMLGEGAEFARATMGMDKMALNGIVEQRLGGPLPPPRYHKASASLPINSIPSPTKAIHSPTSPRSPHQGGHLGAHVSPGRAGGFPHGRSSSIDSLPSLHPSLSESVNTLAERRLLLPQSAHTQTYSTAGSSASHTAPLPARQPLLTTTTTLTPSQRTMLLRRTRKLEQVLGESLPEQQISRHVVDPLNGVTTFDTRVAEDAWPESPMPGAPGAAGRRTPEWEREDCVPQRVKNDPYAAGAGSGGKPGLSRSGSTLAKKAKAAFSLGGSGGEKKNSAEDLRVYVSRQMRVTQTISRGSSGDLPGLPLQSVNREVNGGKGSTGSGESDLVSPVSAKSASTVEEGEKDEEVRRNRRQQLAKLHRLLGAPIPPELLNPTVIEQAPTPLPSSSRTQTPTPMARAPSPSEQSFMTFDEPSTSGTKWSTKLKSLNARRKAMGSSAGSTFGSGSVYGGGGVVGQMGDDASFMDMRDGKKVSKEEKQAARKRAAKLEQMLGDKPPVGMYLSHSPSPRTTSPHQQERLSAYDAYASSLQGLLYLMDNDQNKLAQVMDSLAATGSSPSRGLDDSPSRQPPTPTGKSSIHSSRTGTPSPPSPLIDSPHSSRYPEGYDFLDMDPEEYYAKEEQAMGTGGVGGAGGADPQSHSARRRRTGKLSQFFGESVDLTKSPEDLAMTPPRSRQSVSAARQSAHGGGIGLAPGASGGGGAGSKWRARRETMDAMLGELWRSVQTEVGRGGLKLDEVDRLGDLMRTLNERRRAKERPWEMI